MGWMRKQMVSARLRSKCGTQALPDANIHITWHRDAETLCRYMTLSMIPMQNIQKPMFFSLIPMGLNEKNIVFSFAPMAFTWKPLLSRWFLWVECENHYKTHGFIWFLCFFYIKAHVFYDSFGLNANTTIKSVVFFMIPMVLIWKPMFSRWFLRGWMRKPL